jgi:hypothetical protein
MQLPLDRGPLSAGVLTALRTGAAVDVVALARHVAALPADVDPVTDEDLHLALWVLYELAFRGFEGVDADLEWDPALLAVRGELEVRFESELRVRTEDYVATALGTDGDVADRLFTLTESVGGPSLARFLQREATLEQFLEFMMHRSVYHLKESDPHSFVLARLDGAVKVALAELQYDEYGGGRPARLHATMFGDALAACNLDRDYGVYLDQVPGYTLAVNNAMSLFALHRRLRGAAMGHLGAFEATSSLPCRRVAGGIRRLGLPDAAAAYFDEHVEADAVHEQLAFRDICGTLTAEEPELLEDVFFGAAVCLYLDSVTAQEMLAAWERDGSSLLGGRAETVA